MSAHDCPQLMSFLKAWQEYGGTYRQMWGAKTSPSQKYENVTCYCFYGKSNGDNHPLVTLGIVVDYKKDGYTIFFEPRHGTVDDDLAYLKGLEKQPA